MPIKARLALILCAILSLICATAQAGPATGGLRCLEMLRVPGEPHTVFDISFVDAGGVSALSQGLDLFEVATGAFLGHAGGITGYSKATGFDAVGPNGGSPSDGTSSGPATVTAL